MFKLSLIRSNILTRCGYIFKQIYSLKSDTLKRISHLNPDQLTSCLKIYLCTHINLVHMS